jgi:hypothetical protein
VTKWANTATLYRLHWRKELNKNTKTMYSILKKVTFFNNV